jgi:hypothetical protein
MKRNFASITVTVLCLLLVGCGGPKISAEKWNQTSVATEADLIAAFGAGTPAADSVRRTVIGDHNLPDTARVLQWPDPDEPGVYYLAAIVDGKVEQQIKWHSESE